MTIVPPVGEDSIPGRNCWRVLKQEKRFAWIVREIEVGERDVIGMPLMGAAMQFMTIVGVPSW